jgi:NTE family protein
MGTYMRTRKVAVGCQGGGMHAAFEVGVLTEILKKLDLFEELKKTDKLGETQTFELVGLSGTSAGALCALMTWYGLAPKSSGPGSPRQAIDALNDAWDSFTAETPTENVLSLLGYYAYRLQETETPVLGLNAPAFGINPSSILTKAITSLLPNLDVRKQYFDLADFLDAQCPKFGRIEWANLKTRLLIGASEVVHGVETVFDSALNAAPLQRPARNCWRKRLPLSLSGVAASGTLPEFSQAVRIDGGYYWDGLYSQNPPVRDFLSNVHKDETPDELWIIRINPQQWPEMPASRAEILDRENEMAGNLSLNKELDFVLTMNDVISRYDQVANDYKHVTIRMIKMTEKTADELRYSSKFDRRIAFTNRLRDEGRAVARDWLDRWPMAECYPGDAAYRTPPHP